jgi:outer membrane protein assembly factor BamB
VRSAFAAAALFTLLSVGLPCAGLAAVGAAPTVDGFSPSWGVPGASVTVTGTGFTGATAVTFKGVPAVFTVDSDTEISATVPAAATTGAIAVRTRGGSGWSRARFRVLVAGPGWPQFHYDNAGSGYNPNETIIGTGNVSQLQLAWVRWRGPIAGSPTVANGIAYVIAARGFLDAFDAATGALLWSASLPANVTSSPTVENGVVYVDADDGNLDAFDATSGALRWSAPTGSGYPSTSSPVVARGLVLVGSSGDPYLYAFDAATGAPRWRASIASNTVSSPAVANGIVYIGSGDGNLYALHLDTGALDWKSKTGGRITSSPAVANGVVYAGSQSGSLYAFDATTGATRWSAAIQPAYFSSPAVANGIVYIASSDGLVALAAATGAIRWNITTAWLVDDSPSVANGVVYMTLVDGCPRGCLDAFDASTGTLLWSAPDRGNVAAIANGIVYFASGAVGAPYGALYAFRLPPIAGQ